MNTEEAADIIDGIASSIRSQPNQFSFEVTVTGQSIRATGGGPGLSISVVGGVGGITIGQQVGVNSGASVEIANKAINDATMVWATAAIEALELLAKELREQRPNKSKIQGMLAHLGSLIGVPAIHAAVSTAVTLALA